MKIALKVRAVEGHMIADPRTIGRSESRRIGHDRKVDGTILRGGVEEPRVRHVFVGGEHIIPETTDGYLRRAVLDGSLDYVETIHNVGEKIERTFRDVELVRATVANMKARAAAAAAAKEAAKKAEQEAEAELEKLDAEAEAIGETTDAAAR